MVNTDSFVNTLKGLGTLQWASPEVLLGTHPVGPLDLLCEYCPEAKNLGEGMEETAHRLKEALINAI